MIDTFAVPPKILLLSDHTSTELALHDLLADSKLQHAAVAVQFLNDLSRHESIASNFDIGLVWLREQSRLTSDVARNIAGLGLPLILITDSDIVSSNTESLSHHCEEHLIAGKVTPQLLALAIAHSVTGHQLQYFRREMCVHASALLDAVVDGALICDLQGNVDCINAAAATMFGIEQSPEAGIHLTDLLDNEHSDDVVQFFKNAAHQSGTLQRFSRELKGRRANGELFSIELILCRAALSGPGRQVVSAVIRDLTMVKLHEEELQLAATVFETHTAILITDVNGTILRVNPAFTHITGYSEAEALGNNPKMLQSGYQDGEFYEQLWRTLTRTGRWEGEIWNKRKNGEIYPEFQTITAVKNKRGKVTHYVATFQDITERKQAQALIEHQAFYDALTNLPNRRLILDRLNQELSSARRHQYYGAMLFLDLDRFKTLNDSMGHAVGDLLLQEMAKRLSSEVRKEDTVARLGGDEFVILLPNLSNDKKAATTMAGSIAKKIHSVVCRPYRLEGHDFDFSPSIGVTLYPFANDTADEVLKHADTAMYRAKSKGRNAICFYESSMQVEADKRLKLENELRVALEQNQLMLYYQTQFDKEGQLIGAEALLRWNHPQRGIVEPGKFIALAEEVNLIQPIGNWVLETAVRQLCEWRRTGLFANDEYVAVNVSPKQLQMDDFVSEVARIIDHYNAPPQCLKLELTENVLLHDMHDVVNKMKKLQAVGVTFSMDDFGTGFSSLSYLKRLPFDQIKIDKTFIRDVSKDVNDAAIVETIIAMAEHLNLKVIAEGVETQDELDFLQGRGCNHYQGFYFSEPLNASALEQTLKQLFNERQSARRGAR